MTRTARGLVAATFVCAACAGDPGVRNGLDRVGVAGPERLEGLVRVVGNRPFSRTMIQTSDGEGATITGPFRNEIGRLAGARVRVTGSYREGEFPEPTLEASSYEIVSVDGDEVVLGTLERRDDGYVIERRGVETPVAAVPESLLDRVGALMWVLLDDRGGIARYGIVREPPIGSAG